MPIAPNNNCPFADFKMSIPNFLFHLELPAMLLTQGQAILTLDRVVIQREHPVGGEVEVPGELDHFGYRAFPSYTQIRDIGSSTTTSHDVYAKYIYLLIEAKKPFR